MKYNYSDSDKRKIEQAQELREASAECGISYCLAEDEEYPSNLRQIVYVPPVLYYKGDIQTLNRSKSVAVIGTRKFSPAGKELAYATGRRIAEAGFNLVNGLALGCDTEAIKGALSAGGKCIAILPCGLEQIQPKSNEGLAKEILQTGGCLLSEYPIRTEIQKYRYVERDRLQSGVSQSVLIVEAEKSSGTMHTASFALKQYKRMVCYSHKLLENSSGNRYLEEAGKAEVLQSLKELDVFLENLSNEEIYEQMSLNF